jgi:hypothetical protein
MLPLYELFHCVPISTCSEHAADVGRSEKLSGEKIDSGAGNSCVEGAWDEYLQLFMKGLEEAPDSREDALVLHARIGWLEEAGFGGCRFAPVWTSRAAVDRRIKDAILSV